MYKASKYAFKTRGPTRTEREHQDSCDINKMMKSIHRGQEVRGARKAQQYGYDDTTMSGLEFRIKKSELEKDLDALSKSSEFSEEEIKHIPSHIVKKFGFKTKKKAPTENPGKNATINDVKEPVNEPPKVEPKEKS